MKRKPIKAFLKLRVLSRTSLAIFLVLTLCTPQLNLLYGGVGEAFAEDLAESPGDPADLTESSESPEDSAESASLKDSSFSILEESGKTATCTVTAVAPTYELTVVGGKGSGSYKQWRPVGLVADEPPAGHVFSGWSRDDKDILFSSFSNVRTSLVMPGRDATVRAVFVPVYTLTAVGGWATGDFVSQKGGSYVQAQGGWLRIVADAPPAGMRFVRWTVEPAVSFVFVDPGIPSVTFEMPASDVTVTAVFEKIPIESVSLNRTSLTLEPLESEILIPSVLSKEAGEARVSWSSSDPSIAVVDADGKVTAVAFGTAEITATTRDDGKTATCAVTVVAPKPGTYKLSVIGGWGSGKYARGDLLGIEANEPPEGHRFSHWSPDGPDISFGDPKRERARVSLVMPGRPATVTAVFEKIPVEGAVLSEGFLTLEALQRHVLTTSVLPEDAFDKTVTWSSSDPSVAVVDADGKVTALAPGTAEITATTRDGGKQATCTVTVTALEPDPETPKLEEPASDPETPESETSKPEELKPENPKLESETPKPEESAPLPASKPETPKPEEPKPEEPAPVVPTKAQLDYSLAGTTYTGSAQGVTVKPKTGAGAVTAVYYNGSKAMPRNAGSYAVTVDVAKGKYVRAGRKIPLGTFAIAKADLSKAKATVADAVWSGRQIRPVKFTYNKASFATKTCASSVSYGANKNIGKGTVTITGKGNFTGKKTLTFKILPRKMYAPVKTVVGKRQVKVNWRKSLAAQKVTGYRLRWRAVGTKTWSKEKSYKVSASSATVKGLKKGQRYEFQVRNCRTVGKVKYYGAWSNVRTSAKVK